MPVTSVNSIHNSPIKKTYISWVYTSVSNVSHLNSDARDQRNISNWCVKYLNFKIKLSNNNFRCLSISWSH